MFYNDNTLATVRCQWRCQLRYPTVALCNGRLTRMEVKYFIRCTCEVRRITHDLPADKPFHRYNIV